MKCVSSSGVEQAQVGGATRALRRCGGELGCEDLWGPRAEGQGGQRGRQRGGQRGGRRTRGWTGRYAGRLGDGGLGISAEEGQGAGLRGAGTGSEAPRGSAGLVRARQRQGSIGSEGAAAAMGGSGEGVPPVWAWSEGGGAEALVAVTCGRSVLPR